MSILDRLLRFFGKKRSPEALQIDTQSASKALQERSEGFKALQIGDLKEEKELGAEIEEFPSIELQKDSLQLGIAAGYTGRSLKEIESSLNRIESQMVTKDWLTLKFEDRSPEIIEILRKHEENEEKRFEIIQNLLFSLQRTAEKAPEPIKTELFGQIETIERQLPLTPKMKEALQIIKEAKEISYKDLAQRMGWTEISGLRGLLSSMIKRTNEIERFEKDGQGWVRYTGS